MWADQHTIALFAKRPPASHSQTNSRRDTSTHTELHTATKTPIHIVVRPVAEGKIIHAQGRGGGGDRSSPLSGTAPFKKRRSWQSPKRSGYMPLTLDIGQEN